MTVILSSSLESSLPPASSLFFKLLNSFRNRRSQFQKSLHETTWYETLLPMVWQQCLTIQAYARLAFLCNHSYLVFPARPCLFLASTSRLAAFASLHSHISFHRFCLRCSVVNALAVRGLQRRYIAWVALRVLPMRSFFNGWWIETLKLGLPQAWII